VTAGVSPAQRRRSIAIALALVAMVVIFFTATLVHLGGNVAKRMEQEGKASRSIVVPQETETTGD